MRRCGVRLGSVLANALPDGNIPPADKGYIAQVVATGVWPERDAD